MLMMAVSVSVYKKMVASCLEQAKSPKGTKQRRKGRDRLAARDACILAFAYTCGASSSELIGLKADDCDPGGPTSNGTVTFPSREPRSQELPLLGDTQKIAELWNSLRHGNAPHFFYPMSKYGERCGDQITPKRLRGIVSDWYSTLPKVERRLSDRPTVQQLRSSFRHILKREGVRDSIVRDLMGLRSRRTAPRDDETADERMKDALRMMSRKASLDVRVPPPPERRL